VAVDVGMGGNYEVYTKKYKYFCGSYKKFFRLFVYLNITSASFTSKIRIHMDQNTTLPARQSLDEFQGYVENEFIPAQVKLLEQEVRQGIQSEGSLRSSSFCFQ
jgi:hypothetical protein